ncbi:MAG: iron ABC transporter permease [Pseudomonadales bacterium]|nr:iron ABC transporter permease [Pseudomonadales bacterium]
MISRRPVLLIGIAIGLLIATLLVATCSGSVAVNLMDVLRSLFICPFQNNCDAPELTQRIIWEIRLPRILMALITGAGLAITGAMMQSVTRNPLADPYLFGISSGASLGASIVMSLASSIAISITLGAFLGAMFSVILMLALAGRSAAIVERLLLSGVAVSFMLSAFTSLILYYSSPQLAATLLFWMMGSFSDSQWHELALPWATVLGGTSLFLIFHRWIGVLQAGDENAHTLGVPVNQFRLLVLLVCAAITGVLVAHVGGIGFVGLMIPHIARFLVGAQIHRMLIMCIFLGGTFMVWVDIVAHSTLTNQVLPIGIVTSTVGSLFFFVILKYRSRKD